MSKELVLIPKRKYEDLLQQRMDEPQHGEGLESDDQSNISAQKSNDEAEMKYRVSEENKSIDVKDNKLKDDKLSSYVKMKPATFAKKSKYVQKKKWLTFDI